MTAADQLELFVAPGADEPPAWVASLVGHESAHRDRVLREGGALARIMRSIERAQMPGDQMLDLWRWVMSVRISLGLASHTTVARYAETLARFFRWTTEKSLDWQVLSARDMDAWQKALYMERNNGASWRKVQLQALRSFYDWRSRMGIGVNCTLGVKGPRTAIRTARKYSWADLRKLFGAIDETAFSAMIGQRDKCLLLFLLATGARCDEAGGLRLDQIELREKSGRVRFFGKGSKERVVSMEGPVVAELRAWIMARDQYSGLSDAVFWSTDTGHGNYGQRLCGSAIERVVKRYAKAAGLGSWGVHRFRVTYATRLYDNGTDIERLRIALGHQTIETTRRYLAVSDKQTATRMPAHDQYAALGMRPEGMPGWAKTKEGMT